MRVLKANPRNIKTASETVKQGGLVVYPTDTVYGLGCNPFNVKAVKRVFRVKGDRKKPLPILASDIEQVKAIANLSKEAEKVAKRFWPGPLTIVVPKKISPLPRIVTCNTDSVGVRVPKHDSALQLIHLSGGLLVGTSANKTGEKPPKTAQEAAQKLGEEVDIILDGGPAPLGASSSVVDFTRKRPRLVRKGPIKLSDIQSVLTKNIENAK